MKYQPISCNLYDRIESLAVKRQRVEIVFKNQNNDEIKTTGIIENVYSENKAEYLLIDNNIVRLDKIIKISEI